MKQKIIDLLSKIVFAIGCGMVAIVTRIRDLFSRKKEVSLMAHDCAFLYPDVNQALDAAGNLYHMATTPADRDLACVVHCSWTLMGFGLAKGLPHPPVMYAPPDLEACYQMLATELQPCSPTHGMQAAPVSAINWTKILQLVKFLFDLLGN